MGICTPLTSSREPEMEVPAGVRITLRPRWRGLVYFEATAGTSSRSTSPTAGEVEVPDRRGAAIHRQNIMAHARW